MKKLIYKIFALGLLVVASACSLDEVQNPNAPTYESFLSGATEADVNLLAVGLEAVMRNDMTFHYQTVSIIGREYYDLTGVDPRYTGEILAGPLDNNGFLTTRSFAAWYKIVQSCNLLITAVENSSAGFSVPVADGYYGYAKTLKAFGLMMVANRQWTNGIRTDVADPDNPGPFVTYEQALTDVQTLLTEARSHLANAGTTFNFPISSGFAGYDTPASFSQFNSALASRTALYQGDKAGARGHLTSSFINMSGSLTAGPAHVFGLTGNDIANGLYYIPNEPSGRFMAHDTFVANAEAGDTRVAAKVGQFLGSDGNPARQSFDGLSADYQVRLYSSNTDPVPIIRNEELILIQAEANIGTDPIAVVAALNVIRNAAGLPDYAGATDDASLVNELLNQRRYSLFGEGHRWVDLRRYSRMSDIPLDRSGDAALDAFPTPVTENANLGG